MYVVPGFFALRRTRIAKCGLETSVIAFETRNMKLETASAGDIPKNPGGLPGDIPVEDLSQDIGIAFGSRCGNHKMLGLSSF
jgi:hypothetical protein